MVIHLIPVTGPSRSWAIPRPNLRQLPPQQLDLRVEFAGVYRQLDALLLRFGKLGSQLGVLRHQLQELHVGRHDHLGGVLGGGVERPDLLATAGRRLGG